MFGCRPNAMSRATEVALKVQHAQGAITSGHCAECGATKINNLLRFVINFCITVFSKSIVPCRTQSASDFHAAQCPLAIAPYVLLGLYAEMGTFENVVKWDCASLLQWLIA